ncbi:MAG: ammonium transporter, partial [Actinomycetota bacterium]|nr:ammonium transporter [Actinomycetota bacterium]
LGKYDENGEARPIPGHSLTLGALGVFILWFGWFGFNAGSTLCAVDCDFASAAVTTMLAGAAGAVAAMFTAWRLPAPRKPDVGLTLNGALAGLVGITAGAGYVDNLSAVLIGAVAGVILVFSVIALDRLHIDDPVGAISVHGTAGIWGVLAVGLFAEVEMVEALGLSSGVGGLLVGGGVSLLLTQVVGLAAIVSWTLFTSLTVFKLIERLHGLRVRPDEELGGLDHWEHGSMAYPEFMEQLVPAQLLVRTGARGANGGNGDGVAQPLQR